MPVHFGSLLTPECCHTLCAPLLGCEKGTREGGGWEILACRPEHHICTLDTHTHTINPHLGHGSPFPTHHRPQASRSPVVACFPGPNLPPSSLLRASRPASLTMATAELTITKPDDFHHHFRDGEALEALVPLVASRFRRAIAMPNLKPPVTTTAQALAYRERLMAAVPAGVDFTPLMTLYLTDRTTAEEIHAARASGAVYAVKLYPAGATTNSDSGVTDMEAIRPALEAMAEVGMPLLVHSEVTDAKVDIFDRESAFVVSVLGPLVRENPGLKVVMEHITTSEGVDFVMACGPNVGATITPQHLMYNRNAIFQGGLQPHLYCLPVLKHERHRQALLRAVASGSPKFFLGTDSAPHPKIAKESSCGCAGCFSAFAGLELYAEVFESLGAMDKFEAFTSKNGAAFYGLSENEEKLTLRREPWTVPATYPLGKDTVVVPLKAGQEMAWAVKQE